MAQRVLIGKFPDGGYGIRVSEPGYDVTSNPVDNARLTFSSDWAEVLPVLHRGTFSITNTEFAAKFADYPYPGYIPFARFFLLEPAVNSTDSLNFTTTTVLPSGWTYQRGSRFLGFSAVATTAAEIQDSPRSPATGNQGRLPYMRFEVRPDGVYAAYLNGPDGNTPLTIAFLLFRMRAI